MVWFYLTEEDGFRNISIAVASIVVSFYFQSLYSDFTRRSRVEYLQQITVAVGLMLLTQALVAYISGSFMLPRWGVLAGSLLLLIVFPSGDRHVWVCCEQLWVEKSPVHRNRSERDDDC